MRRLTRARRAVLNKIISFGPVKSFSYARLKLLQAKRNLYMQLNEEKELVEMKGAHRPRTKAGVRAGLTHACMRACDCAQVYRGATSTTSARWTRTSITRQR